MQKRTAVVLKWGGIVVLVLGFAYGALEIASRRALKREYEALRAEGRPLELREIVPAAIPDAENAALVYNAAIQMLKSEPPVKLDGYTPPSGRGIVNLFEQLGDVASVALGSPTNTVAAEQAARLLGHPRVVEFLADIERGSARPGYRQELDYSQGPGMLLPHLSANRMVSRVLSVLARQQAVAGHAEAAWRTALMGIRFADSLRDEPILISQLVRKALLEIAVDALRSVAEIAPPSVENGAKLETLLASFESHEPLVRCLDGERLFFGEWAFRLRASEIISLSGNDSRRMRLISWGLSPFKGADHAAYLRILRACARNAAEPYAPRDAGIRDQMINEVPRYCIMTQRLVPALSATKAKFTAMIAQIRVTRAGLSVIRHKQEHGTFPDDLQALKLANADDPFTGKPLIYRPTARGFMIYSVGVNLGDDGGTGGEDAKSGDQVWWYEVRNPAEQQHGLRQ